MPNDNAVALGRLLPFASPFLYGACCYFAVAVPYLLEGKWTTTALVAVFVVCLFGTAGLTAFSAEEGASRYRKITLVTTPALLAAGSFLFLLLVDSSAARFITVTGCMLLLAAYYARLDIADDEGFWHLSRAVRAVALFFLLAFAFGVTRFVHAPLPLMVALAATGLGLAAHQDLRRVAPPRAAAGYAAVMGLLGGELYLGLSLLPTPFMTNAAVLLVATEMISTAMRGVFAAAPKLVPRSQAVAAALLAVALLGTSPWF